MFYKAFHFIKTKWLSAEEGLAAIEATFVFPLLAVLMLGTFDIGNGLVAHYKTIRASQVTADLVTRASEVSNSMIDEAVWAGELALQPLDTASFGVDVVSIEFDNNAVPRIVWRETRNMTANANAVSSVAPLAEPNSGVVVVTVEYQYVPVFEGFSMGALSIGQLPIREVAFSRGRKSAVVERI